MMTTPVVRESQLSCSLQAIGDTHKTITITTTNFTPQDFRGLVYAASRSLLEFHERRPTKNNIVRSVPERKRKKMQRRKRAST